MTRSFCHVMHVTSVVLQRGQTSADEVAADAITVWVRRAGKLPHVRLEGKEDVLQSCRSGAAALTEDHEPFSLSCRNCLIRRRQAIPAGLHSLQWTGKDIHLITRA